MSPRGLRRLVVLSEARSRTVVRAACVICLVALGLMVWSLFSKTVLAVMVAMSVGQALGTVSLVMYLWAVSADLLRTRVLGEKQDE